MQSPHLDNSLNANQFDLLRLGVRLQVFKAPDRNGRESKKIVEVYVTQVVCASRLE
jgi:hypothetical protein